MLKRHAKSGSTLLDVGCGFGRLYQVVVDQDVKYYGLEANPETVAWNQAKGRSVLGSLDSPALPALFDFMLFSHIIEHFSHHALLQFLNQYLARLRPSGFILILTPVLHRGFYDDFDHVKPYNPEAIRQIFCGVTQQLQPFDRPERFKEIDLWFKRDPLWHSHRRAKWNHLISAPLTLACILSRGFIGKLTGYGILLQHLSE